MSSVFYRTPNKSYRVAESGEGMFLVDANGDRYLDMSGGAAVSLLGHQHPDVLRGIRAQLDKLAYAHTAFFTTTLQEQLAERLVARFPDSRARVYFTGSGSEANETAIKMAWRYWRGEGKQDKQIVVSRMHSYHGNTFLALSLSGNPLRRVASAAPLLDWPRISPCYPFRFQREAESLEEYALRAAQELESAIEEVGAERIAAFICEPVVGASLGAVPAAPGYLAEIRRICDKHDVLMILDEVMCGSGRSGTFYSFEQDGVQPDLATLGKGISGGYQPLAAVVMGSRVADSLAAHGFIHGFTYVGHAVALAAGCAVQDVIDQTGLLDTVRERGEEFSRMLSRRFASHDNVADIRGRGLLLGIELASDRQAKTGFDAPVAERLRDAALERKLICYPGEIMQEDKYIPHILLAPPAIVETRDMQTCCDIIEALLAGL